MSLALQKRLEAVVKDGGAIPGCEFGEVALTFSEVSAEVLALAGARLQVWEKKAAWYWGDYMVAYCDFVLEQDERERREDAKEHGRAFIPLDEMARGEALVRYSSQYAGTAGVEPGTLWQRKSLASFYQPCTRVQGLTYDHHRIAKWGSGGDLAVAQELLALALEKGWKASRLKAHINQTKRDDQGDDEGPTAQTLLPMELVACRRFASAHIASVADMDVEEARAHLAELEQVHAYIMALTRRVCPTLSTLPTPGGKESLLASA
jgi:hypothetical protein